MGSRWQLLLLGALAWVLIIVIGAGPQGDDAFLGVENLDAIWAVALSAGALVGLIIFIRYHPFSRNWSEPPRNRGRGAAAGLLMLVALVVLLWRPDLTNVFQGDDLAALEQLDGEALEDLALDMPSRDTVAQVSELLAIAALVGLCALVIAVMRFRQTVEISEPTVDDDPVPPADLAVELADTIDRASRRLGESGDPRTAVLESYAMLEATLADHNVVRRSAETPTEHLRRSVAALPIDDAPLVQLGALYEVARFSSEPVTVEQQQSAAQALSQANQTLGAS